jgi:hypothetical protein
VPPTRIPKSQLGPLNITDADVTSISLSRVLPGSAVTNQVVAFDGDNWVPFTLTGLAQFADAETPVGTQNSTNVTFTLVHTPTPTISLQVFIGGVLLKLDNDYTLTDNVLTFGTAPGANDILLAYYRF